MEVFFNALVKAGTYSFILLALFVSLPVFSQVGFNNPNPDSSALIDMKATDKGLLIPRMTSTERELMSSGGKRVAHALLVFDTDQNVFFVYDTVSNPDRWSVLNPLNSPSNVAGNIGVGTFTPMEKLEVNGNVKANAFIGNGTIPLGGIILWSGDGSSIPQGWALCDGSNNTPDLRQRFIVGAGGDNPSVAGVGYNSGIIGGNDFVTLTANQSGLPTHSHAIDDLGHDHSINDPGHSHSINSSSAGGGNGEIARLRSPVNGTNMTNSSVTGISIVKNKTGIIIQNSSSKDATIPFDNRPPFYALAFIMRIQ